MSNDLFAAELRLIAVETNCEMEGMKAGNVAARIASRPVPFDYAAFMALLARHEARVDACKRARMYKQDVFTEAAQ